MRDTFLHFPIIQFLLKKKKKKLCNIMKACILHQKHAARHIHHLFHGFKDHVIIFSCI